MMTALLTGTICLVLGLASGSVMYRSDYCIAGMFRDFFLFRRTFMLRSLLLLVASSAVIVEGGRLLGLLRPYPFPLIGAPSLSNVAGGFLFGVGMVLAGGCVVGTLYKMGSGSTVSMAAFAGLLAGSFLYAEVHPQWSAFKASTTFLEGRATVAQALGVSPLVTALLFAVPAAFVLHRWRRAGALVRKASVESYLQPWRAALMISAIGFVSYVTIGMPLGITTAYSKWGAAVVKALAPGHVASLAYLQAMPLDYTHPLTGARLTGGPGPQWDAISVIQYPLIVGVVLGSFLTALWLKEFRVYGGVPGRQLVSGAVGGAVMGMASRMAPSCNVWHLLGGVPIFALQSIFFAAGLVPGAWVGTKLLTGVVLKDTSAGK